MLVTASLSDAADETTPVAFGRLVPEWEIIPEVYAVVAVLKDQAVVLG
jgi:hypothetical protein